MNQTPTGPGSPKTGRSSWEGPVRVYRYGTPRGTDLGPAAMDQLRMAHELRNELVAIEYRYEHELASAWATEPELGAANEAVDRAAAALEALRTRPAPHPHPSTAAEESSAAREAAAQVLRTAKARRKVLKQRHHRRLLPELRRVTEARNAARKSTYRSFVQERGLYWATYNDVLAYHRAAVARVAARRKAGQPAQLRFQRWNGTGSLCVQLQRDAHHPPRTPRLLASGQGPWSNVCQMWPWIEPAQWKAMARADQRRVRIGGIAMALGRGRKHQLEILVHRMLPAEADITLVRVTRSRIAAHHGLHVSVTARLPPVAREATDPVVALHVGWRAMSDGSLRVGTYRSTGPLPQPPAGLDDVVRPAAGDAGHIHFPHSWRLVAKRIAGLRARRDRNLNELRRDLVDSLSTHPDRAGYPSLEDVRRWRSAADFARLAHQWRHDPPVGGAQLASRLETWRRHDHRLWEWEANERDQLLNRRTDAWRRVAAWLTETAAVVVLDDVDISALTRRPQPGDDGDARARMARSNRVNAAPGLLRAALRSAAGSRGIPVEVASAVGITRVHSECGGKLPGREMSEQVMVWCPTCEQPYDQDINAAVHLLGFISAVRAS